MTQQSSSMGPVPPRSVFLRNFGSGARLHGVDFIRGENYPKFRCDALQLEHSCPSLEHRNRVHTVRIHLVSPHSGNDSGSGLRADLPGDPGVQSGDGRSVRNTENQMDHWYCTAVSAYEDTVAIVSGNHVYVSSPTFLAHKLRGRLNSTRLGEYKLLALEDEIYDDVLPLTELSAVPKLFSFPETVRSVACGTEHVLFCTSIGRLYSMGSNRHGQLGRGTRSSDIMGLGIVHIVDKTCTNGSGGSWSPAAVEVAAVEVYAGSNFSFVVARKRSLRENPCGFLSSKCSERSAEGAAVGAKLSPASCSDATPRPAARRKRTRLWSESATPYVEHTFPSVPSRALPPHAKHTCAGSEMCVPSGNGKGEALYSWGCNDYGQLGHGTKEPALQPVQVKQPEGVSSWKSVAAGFAHVVVLSGTSTVYSCGLNLHGQLGLETTREETTLQKIVLPEPVQQISCGTWHTLLLTSTGHLLTAGRPPEFPYPAWLQSAASPAEMYNVNPIRVGVALPCNADAEVSPAISSSALKRNPSIPAPPSIITAGNIQAPEPTSDFQAEVKQPKGSTAMVSSCHTVLLSTTSHLCKSRVGVGTLVDSKTPTCSDLSGSHTPESTPFASAPGILRIKGFREDLKCISAGQTTSAAIGFDVHTKRYHLYLWKAAESREYPENGLFMCNMYDYVPPPVLERVDHPERATVACLCAASGVYLWTTLAERESNAAHSMHVHS